MSVFTPVDVNAPFDRKKALIQKLMGQYQAAAQRAQGLMGRGVGSIPGMGTSMHGGRPFGGSGIYTGAQPHLAAALLQRLGPGGVGHPILGRDMSEGPGSSVLSSLGAAPHRSLAGAAPGTPMPIPTTPGGTSVGSPTAAPAAAAPAAPAGALPPVDLILQTPGAAGPGGATNIDNYSFGSFAPANQTSANGLIPLGNGHYFDPVNGVLVAPGTAGGRTMGV